MKLKKKIVSILKKNEIVYNFFYRLIYGKPLSRLVLCLLLPFPKLHSKFIVKHSSFFGFGRKYPRKIPLNLKEPVLFHEKALWLKYYCYNRSKLCSICFDKYLVRDYIEKCGCGEYLNELYGVWDDVNKIPWNDLPEEYVLKKANGCGNHIFKTKETVLDVKKSKKYLKSFSKIELREAKITGSLFAVKNKQRYICEKMLKSTVGFSKPEDIKFYCFNGEPKFTWYVCDRHNDHDYSDYLFDSFTFEDRSDLCSESAKIDINLPNCYWEMIDICRKLSKPFPFVRIDFYVQDDKPIFGELTFCPYGSFLMPYVFNKDNSINYEGLRELGELINLEKESIQQLIHGDKNVK